MRWLTGHARLLVPDAGLSPQSTSIDVLVREVECASGQSAEGRILDPEASLGAEQIGDRTLLDGAHDPPAVPDNDRVPSDR